MLCYVEMIKSKPMRVKYTSTSESTSRETARSTPIAVARSAVLISVTRSTTTGVQV